MNYLETIITAALTTLFITAPLLIFWLKTRLEKSIQSEYDKQLENFKMGCQQIINKSNVSFSWWHNERANAMKIIYSSLAELEIALKHATPIMTPDFTSSPKEEIKKYFENRFDNLQTVYHNAYHTWANNRIFLESDINNDIDNMINKCNSAVFSYKNALANYGNANSIEDFDIACKSVVDFENLLKKIQTRFETLLQFDPENQTKEQKEK